MQFQPTVGEAMRQKLPQFCSQRGEISRRFWITKCRGDLVIGGEVEKNGLWIFPVGGDLQNCGTAEAAMRDQHFFAELLAAARHNHFS